MSKIYEKWRELNIDPFEIDFKNFRLNTIISYPPAGNDVIECIGLINNELKNVVIKIERSKMANFDNEVKVLNLLSKTDYNVKIPVIYETGEHKGKKYTVLEKLSGERLSDILINTNTTEKHNYIYEYGKELAYIHRIPHSNFDDAKIRNINDIPKLENYKEFDEKILPYIEYVVKNKPVIFNNVFIHGDFHYANLLWNEGKMTGILDFEYAGKGFKEQDIAWACILRSTQNFMNNYDDIETFLKGYSSLSNYDSESLKWCLINGYCHFYLMNKDNVKYQKKILELMDCIII